MLQLSYKRNNFPFQYPFQISKGIKTEQESLHVRLGLAALKGWGETTTIAYNEQFVEKMIPVLEQKRAFIERYTFIDPERFWHFLHHLIPQEHFLTAALDMAGWDLFGQMRRKPVYELLGLTWDKTVPTDYTLAIGTMEEVVTRAKAHPAPIYKLKVSKASDVEIIAALRAETNALIRIDANEAWTLEDARTILPALEALNIELIEQPLHKQDWEGMTALQQLTNIPIVADESCQREADLEQIATCFQGVNIKLAKCSGITPAVSLIKAAKNLQLKVMLGCMSEGVVGCTAMSHLLPLADWADIDGPLILKDESFRGIQYDQGNILLPQGVGLGLKEN